MKKYLSIILLISLILTIVIPVYAQNDLNSIKAKVIKNNGTEDVKEKDEPTKKVQNLTVRILEGEYDSEEYEMVYIISEDIDSIISNIELTEDENILVKVEEKAGEVTNISYIETVSQSYILYIIGVILAIALLVISKKRATVIYVVTILLIGVVFVFSMQKGLNLILISSILSLVITIPALIKVNGINKKTLIMVLSAILSIYFAYIVIDILFNVVGLMNINIKIAENFVNIKELICAAIILISCGVYNYITIATLSIYSSSNKSYKTKSDNIIEGQRSLKL